MPNHIVSRNITIRLTNEQLILAQKLQDELDYQTLDGLFVMLLNNAHYLTRLLNNE
jgi:hypothetical protein